MSWGNWTYRLYAFVPNVSVGTWLDFASPLLIEGVNETLMLNNWQYSANGSQPYSYAACNIPIHENTLQQYLDAFVGSLSEVKYYIVNAETRLLAYTSGALTVGATCTWAQAVTEAMSGLSKIASTSALQSSSTIYNHDSISSPVTSGGNSSWVIAVTNTNDSGPGSLRDALVQNFPRYVKVLCSGVVSLLSTIYAAPNLTLDVPSPYEFYTRQDGIYWGHDSIVRGMRLTNGVPTNQPSYVDACGCNANNIDIGFCHIYWGADSNLEIIGQHIFIHDSIIAEALTYYDKKGINITQGGGYVTLYRNLILTNDDRNPTMFSGYQVDMYNNIIANWQAHPNIQPRDSAILLNLIKNKFIVGTTYPTSARQFVVGYIQSTDGTGPNGTNPSAYVAASGQYLEGNVDTYRSDSVWSPQTDLIQTDSGVIVVAVSDTPYPTLLIDQSSLIDVDANFVANILATVGCPTTDVWKQHILDEINNASWTLMIGTQADSTGYPT